MARMPSAERRRQLTEAAIRAMTRDGVSKTTTRSIAAEADLSLSVFHYCFDSKQALIESVITTITEHSTTVVREAIRPKATLRETVRAGFQAYWDHVSAHPGEHMLTYELTQYALRQPGFEHLARRQYQLYCDTYTELVEQLGRSMDFELRVPVLVLARYLAAMTDGLTLNFLVLGDDAAWADILDMITDHVAGLVRDTDDDLTGLDGLTDRNTPASGSGPAGSPFFVP
ncbi:TetR/AcrR family transcriptional regulator [Streptomyces sp. NBC_00878]|uniref:TetR/AcrR family transcriptional regulator n=1 Tax=Streptomyces sp. NBC_00878 TaxID=2975854 RepID=UPI00225088F9|nr:TetR/AcrR family transcriptional regulator [Streptomyces sp. NBC_00878]MCX4903008.1 TetR/AcrR family transcriptional regulator [Streptomyces sp. NBC_00878]